jgi:leucine dehydrogenase
MTYKAAISGVDLGGGKSVILGDPQTEKTEPLLRAMGRCIDALHGLYIAGQDIGTNSHDMAVIARETTHVTCVAEEAGGYGDPSFVTAAGVVAGAKAVLAWVRGSDSLSGRRVAVQGLGNVGYRVARLCHEEGAHIIAADLSPDASERAARELDAEIVDANAIYDVECDIFSPCSVGGVVNDDTIPRMRCLGLAGGANNVLAEARHALALAERGIAYAPDYLVNSGGLIHCQAVLRGDVDRDCVLKDASRIFDQTLAVFENAKAEKTTTAMAADRIAEARIARARLAPR